MSRYRYYSRDEDSSRWGAWSPRRGDIVVSTRSKHGTTWVQAILLHLIHGADLPAPLVQLSPWLDHLVEPLLDILHRLDGQPHRRVIKTHTPLDGVPIRPEAHYIVVARDPLDAAISMYHHIRNLDRRRMAELVGAPVPPGRPVVDLVTWLSRWVVDDPDPRLHLDSLNGVAHHLRDAWGRRALDNLTLVRYADLVADRPGQVARLAARLDLPTAHIEHAVTATSLAAMRADAQRIAPDPAGIIRDPVAFFRRGGVGESRRLDARLLERYDQRLIELMDRDLLDWLQRGDLRGEAATVC